MSQFFLNRKIHVSCLYRIMLLQHKYRPGVCCITGNVPHLRVIVSYAFDTFSQVDCVSGGIFGKLMGSHEQWLFLLLAARTWPHTEPENVTGEETVHVYGPTGDSNRGPLAYRARIQTTELKSHTHRRPVTISICLIRFIPESTRNHAETDETVPVLSAAQTWTHTEPQNVKGEVKLPIIFTLAEDRTRDPLHANPNLYRAAIKAGLYHKAVQVTVIYLILLHILASIVGTYRLLLLVHFKSVRFVCLFFCCCFFNYGEVV